MFKYLLFLVSMLFALVVNAEVNDETTIEDVTIELDETIADIIEPTDTIVDTVTIKDNKGGSVMFASTFVKRIIGKEPRSFEQAMRIKPENYTFWKEQTYAGIPLFAAGIALKSQKRMFRQFKIGQEGDIQARYNNQLLKGFDTWIDDWTQYLPLFTTIGMNLAGYEGRSNTPRMFASGVISYATMAILVNGIKYTAKEMRPDGSSRNSWPSGHTATAFTAASILHKEYGLTRSPWFSIGGYAMATATGFMRIMNNRHWINDIVSGAGIGIFATEVGYGIANLIWKDKGIRRANIVADHSIIENPSFFSLGLGASFGSSDLTFDYGGNKEIITLRTGTSVHVEAAYFLNKYIGIGGRARVRANPVNNLDGMQEKLFTETKDVLLGYKELIRPADYALLESGYSTNVEIVSDYLSEFSGGFGPYFNFPLNRYFALGGKVLLSNHKVDNVDIVLKGSPKHRIDGWILDSTSGNVHYSLKEEKDVNIESSLLKIEADNGWSVGTGVSLTYAAKENFSWRLFVDYDYCRRNYSMTLDKKPIFESMFTPETLKSLGLKNLTTTDAIRKNLHNIVVGGSFCISL